MTLDGFSSSGVGFSTTCRLILMAALKSRFTNSMRFLLLMEFTFARIVRTRALGVTTVPSSSHQENTFSPLFSLFFLFVTCSSSPHRGREEDCGVFSGSRR
jgi:hypothetical protein